YTIRGGHALSMSYPDFLDFRDSTGVFSSAVVMVNAEFAISSNGEPARVRGVFVSADYFKTLEVHMALGRGFLANDDRVTSVEPAAVISHRLWQERFGGVSNVIGSRMVLNGRNFTVVGVAPERFNGPSHSERRDVW